MELAGEYAVATELCRRGIYAQITLGKHKRTDILVETETGMLRIQVKAKGGESWPNCTGIYGPDIALVFVDFAGKQEDERPDFYILTSEDWAHLVKAELRDPISKAEVVIDDKNTPVWMKQVNARGRPYKGMDVRVSQISAHKERWDKLKAMLSSD